jgi:hypothetical protein
MQLSIIGSEQDIAKIAAAWDLIRNRLKSAAAGSRNAAEVSADTQASRKPKLFGRYRADLVSNNFKLAWSKHRDHRTAKEIKDNEYRVGLTRRACAR